MKIAHGVGERIAERLHAAIGLDVHGLDLHGSNQGRLRWIVASRCRALGLADAEEYATYLDATQGEMDALIDEAVVAETRFFRDPAVFEHIRMAIEQIAATTAGPVRVLSAPCGTGQEAYSLAAMLRLAKVGEFEIDAVDVSPAALEVARLGVYPERALTQVAAHWREACAVRDGRQWRIRPGLMERVQFERRNLAAPGALGERPRYHLILCRNLFIYLAASARRALAESLAGALLPGGKLFLGTADRVEELLGLFAPVRPAASFAFVHRREPIVVASLQVAGRQVVGRSLPATALRSERSAPQEPSDQGSAAVSAGSIELLQQAMRLRQLGDLVRAERRCRQALYLAPDLLPAMELLQSLWAMNPNVRLRRALRDRILRNRMARRGQADVSSRPDVAGMEGA